MAGRRDRSRSPMRGDNAMRRRENKNGDQKTAEGISNVINPMMMANMYPQGDK